MKNKDIKKRFCREGFVGVLHFEGGRILPYIVGKGSVVFGGEAGEGCTSFEEASMILSTCGEG